MQRHGENMENLMWAALMLDYESAATISAWIDREPRISRPTGSSDTLNEAFPERFFELQDALHEAARDLADAAESRDDPKMATAYGKLSNTCVSCHSIYLHLRPPE